MDEDVFYTDERQRMVEEQLIYRNIRDERVLEAMRSVPRHAFVPLEYRHMAYSDGPLPIGSGQTISQPYIVALMTQLLRLKGDENVLEVGTGSGYQAAVLAKLAKQVYTIERYTELADQAAAVLQKLGLNNVRVHIGDGSLGLPEHAPFQAILVTAAAPKVPQSLLEQLDEGGRLVVPVGGRMNQFLELWERRGAKFVQDVLVPVAFVPLRGRHGWKEDSWEVF
ncbi:MAG TPA: protein-L-isoaspartate(D-aspartate) O-methyltransferase [Anaerolineales bacterium]